MRSGDGIMSPRSVRYCTIPGLPEGLTPRDEIAAYIVLRCSIHCPFCVFSCKNWCSEESIFSSVGGHDQGRLSTRSSKSASRQGVVALEARRCGGMAVTHRGTCCRTRRTLHDLQAQQVPSPRTIAVLGLEGDGEPRA